MWVTFELLRHYYYHHSDINIVLIIFDESLHLWNERKAQVFSFSCLIQLEIIKYTLQIRSTNIHKILKNLILLLILEIWLLYVFVYVCRLYISYISW